MSFSDVKINTSGGLYLKVESGKPAVLRVLQDMPAESIIHGFGKDAKECGGDHCQFCGEKDANGEPTKHSKRRQRFKLNAYSHDSSKVMIWEFGPQIMELLQNTEGALKIQALDILDVDLMVSSTGEGLDKTYSIQPMLKSKEVPTGLVLHKLDLPF